MDETLIHSHYTGFGWHMVPSGTPHDFIIKVPIDKHPVSFYVYKRPHVDYFLDMVLKNCFQIAFCLFFVNYNCNIFFVLIMKIKVSEWYDLVVFTASLEIYGAAVADHLDRNRKILNRRYFRQHCTFDINGYTKDLSAINSDLSSIFILDNSPGAYRAYPGIQTQL